MLEKKRDNERGLTEAPPHYHGHRERLRGRFREAGPDALSDYELLEAVLFRALPRRDVKPLAKTLIATFGSFAEVISAPAARLAEVKGMGEASITELKIVQAAASRLLRGEVKKRPVLSSWSAVLDYCRTARVHNHPSGDPTPSQADIEMTQQIITVARPLGIAVHDHIIVGKDGHVSLKGLKRI